jgi:LytS/YehU family sensor histidine kinase
MVQKNRLLTLLLCFTNIRNVASCGIPRSKGSSYKQNNLGTTVNESWGRICKSAKSVPVLSFSVLNFAVPFGGLGLHHVVLGAQFWALWNAILIVIAVIAIGAALVMRREYDRKKEKVAYNNRLMELEAKALTSQMNPHFIYNSLSTVQHLIVLNEQQKAFDYISDFSLLMRQMLNNSRKSYVALEDEIDFLTRYMELERFRFSNSFEYEFQVEDAIKVHSHRIAPMLIQPILENAIKHGMGPKKDKGILKISFSFHKDILECVVDDNGAGWKQSRSAVSSLKHESTALNIIRERLNIIKSYDDNPGRLEIVDKVGAGYSESGTIVKIFIPIINSL